MLLADAPGVRHHEVEGGAGVEAEEMNAKKTGKIFVTACICAFGGVLPLCSCCAWVWRTWYQPVSATSARSM